MGSIFRHIWGFGLLDENLIAGLASRGLIGDTFRRLLPEKKERIYRAAIKLFGLFGYDGLAIDELCLKAGISKGSFFQYFPSKSHLLEFTVLVFDDYLARLTEDIRQSDQGIMAGDRLQYLYHALVVNSRMFAAEERFYLFVTRALDHAAVTLEGIDLERHFRDYVTDIIRRGEETGEIRGDVEVELTGHLTSLVIGALVRKQYSIHHRPPRKTGEYLVSFLFDGIRA